MAQFHYSDVLSVTDGRLISFDHMNGVCRVFFAIFGENQTAMLPGLAPFAREYLLARYPQLATPEIKEAIRKAIHYYKEGYGDREECVDKFVLPLVSREIEVEPMPEENRKKALESAFSTMAKLLKDKEVIFVTTE